MGNMRSGYSEPHSTRTVENSRGSLGTRIARTDRSSIGSIRSAHSDPHSNCRVANSRRRRAHRRANRPPSLLYSRRLVS